MWLLLGKLETHSHIHYNNKVITMILPSPAQSFLASKTLLFLLPSPCSWVADQVTEEGPLPHPSLSRLRQRGAIPTSRGRWAMQGPAPVSTLALWPLVGCALCWCAACSHDSPCRGRRHHQGSLRLEGSSEDVQQLLLPLGRTGSS